jgi:putative glutamine amidotransferase
VRPLIGVSTSEVRLASQVDATPQSDPPRREMALGLTYLKVIEAAGGIPVVMPPLDLAAVDPLLDRLSGVCLSGGPDLDPAAYTERRHPELGPVEPDLDRFELELARRADAHGLPILAICRGTQALNVARGGSLHQHLPDRPGVTLHHRQAKPGNVVTHSVTITPGSKLARTMKRARAEVNSFHHQAINRLGANLRAVAWSSDGVIEGIEAPARPFLLGVQWHVELLPDRPEHFALFTGLVAAATAFEADTRVERAA